VRWRLEQADEFRQEVEQYTDAERVVLADAYQALLRFGPLPDGSVRLRRVAVDPDNMSGEAAMAKVAGRTRQRPGLVGRTAGARCGWGCSPPPYSSAA
jgi:hypothetical protein